jgi:uncharacterized protein
MNIPVVISKELSINVNQVNEVITLFSEGSTVPFIARYRKERTGGLDEDVLRNIDERFNYLTLLEERKATILNSISEQGKLTPELETRINECSVLQELEDLYLPYKPKRKTKGTVAKARGLEPLALFILENPLFDGDFDSILSGYINEELGVNNIEEALQGAKDILAEMISDDADVRKDVREFMLETPTVKSEKTKEKVSEGTTNEKLKDKEQKDIYRLYYDFQVDIKRIKPYQVLALNRGEKEKFLKVNLVFDEREAFSLIKKRYFKYEKSVFDEIIDDIVSDSFKRLISPSIDREVRNYLTETADLHAIEIFASNLKQLLLQPPFADKIIMGIDPGFVSGCKVAVIDQTGKYLEGDTIYPHPPKNRTAQSIEKIASLARKYNVELIAIGNGTASRETELLVASIIKEQKLKSHYVIVSEAGASVYSASETAKKEFPELEASQRGNISIARRLLDPLAELVKIDPKSIGVGLYQHDVDQKFLAKKLDDVVESCVNYVGVDVNTASASLLTYVSGLNKRIAENIVKYRDEKGKFSSRNELMNVTGLGAKAYEQCAGFLKIRNGNDPFDNTFIHPESYQATHTLLKMANLEPGRIQESGGLIDLFVRSRGIDSVVANLGIGKPTLLDIIENLKKPGRDPREDMPKPILRSDILKIEDLQIGMRLKGTVRNIVDFGAFVDIGVKQSGLLHISQMANKFVKNPLDILSVGDIIDVSIVEIDIERGRIALSLK